MAEPDPRVSSTKTANLLQAGTQVAHFKVLRLLGRGGMGEVYLARDVSLGRKVALKVVRPESLGTVAAAERFLFEARTTARFNHPHIVTIYSVGEHEECPFVALEYLEGQDLRLRMQEDQPSLMTGVRFGLAVAEALVEAHSHGILHRDLKPENVFIPNDGRLRVLDFGLAKVLESEPPALPSPDEASAAEDDAKPAEMFVTAGDGLRGTPTYMAPEQWDQEEVSSATDIWALGVILYELLVGRRPYDASSPFAMAAKVTADEPVETVAAQVRLPPALTDLVDGCLCKDPNRRPTATHAAEVLGAILHPSRKNTSIDQSPFRGLLPFGERHADLFFGRDGEISTFLERVRNQTVLPVVGPSGGGKSSFIQAGILPRLREQGPLSWLQLRPGTKPFHTLADRLIAGDTAYLGPSTLGGTASDPAGSTEAGEETVPALEVTRPLRAPTIQDIVEGESDAGGEHTLPMDVQDTVAVDGMESPLPEERIESSEARIESSDAVVPEPPETPDLATLALELEESPRHLALYLARLAEQQQCQVVLFVDQLEELHTLVPSEQTRRRFMEALCSAADDAQSPIRVVFTLRDDFLGRLALGPVVREAFGRVTVIRSPEPDALKEILTSPLTAVDGRYEDPQLVDEMIAAVQGEPASLPLLQFACGQLWEQRDPKSRSLTRAAYDAMGGVGGALARHADGILDGMTPKQVGEARKILLRLVSPDRTRKVVTEADLLEGGGEDAPEVLSRLVDGRLLSVRRAREEDACDAEYELVHESLVRTWDRLARWLDESHEELSFLHEIGQAAELWEKRGAHRGEVWSGAALHDAQRSADRVNERLPARVQRFLRAGVARERRRVVIKRSVVAGIIIFLLAAVLVVTGKERQAQHERSLAERQRRLAERQRKIANIQRRQAQVKRAEALSESARSALEQHRVIEARAKLRMAFTLKDDLRARTLWWRLQREPLLWSWRGQGVATFPIWSPDGKTIAVADGRWQLKLINLWTRRVRPLIIFFDRIYAVAISQDGKTLATVDSVKGQIRLTDLATGKIRRTIQAKADAFRSVIFHPQGGAIASINGKTITLWDTTSGQALRVLRGHTARIASVRFSADGRTLVTASADRTVRVWDAQTGKARKVLRSGTHALQTAVISRDGRRVAAGYYGGSVQLWDLPSGRPSHRLKGHQHLVLTVAFHPNGRQLASGDSKGRLRLWNVETGAAQRNWKSGMRMVWRVGFDATGRFLAAGGTGTVKVFDLATGLRREPPRGHRHTIWSVAWGPRARMMATADETGEVWLWDLATAAARKRIRAHRRKITGMVITPDGRQLVTASNDHTLRAFALPSGLPLRTLPGHTGMVLGLALHPNGREVASCAADGTARIWDLRSGRVRRTLDHKGTPVYAVAFSPDGRTVVTGASDGLLRLWDLNTGRLRKTHRGQKGRITSLAVSPDGGTVASGGRFSREVRLWNLREDKSRVLAVLKEPNVSALQFHPEGGAHLVVSNVISSAVFDVRTGKKLLRRATWTYKGRAIRYSPRGEFLLTVDGTNPEVWSAKTFRPHWRAIALSQSPVSLLTHRGWMPLNKEGKTPRPSAWTKALAQRAVQASVSESGDVLCLRTNDNVLEIWDTAKDRRTFRYQDKALVFALAHPKGCLTISWMSGTRLYNRTGLVKVINKVAGFIGVHGKTFIAISDKKLSAFDLDGNLLPSHPRIPGATEMVRVPAGWAVALSSGLIEIRRDGNQGTVVLKEVPLSDPAHLMAGPGGILIVSFNDGSVGLWSTVTGVRLYHRKLNGKPLAMTLQGTQLYAATALGDHISLDLKIFAAPYCALLTEVRQRILVEWSQGHAIQGRSVLRKGHRCAGR